MKSSGNFNRKYLNSLSFGNYILGLVYYDDFVIKAGYGYLQILNFGKESLNVELRNDKFYQHVSIVDEYTTLPLYTGQNKITLYSSGKESYDRWALNYNSDENFFRTVSSMFRLSPDVSNFFNILCNNGNSDSEAVQCLIQYFIENYDYDYDEMALVAALNEWRPPSPNKVFDQQKGICYDIAALFVSVLRYQGIPAKLVEGYLVQNPEFHAWPEVLIDGEWQALDITYGILHKTEHIIIAKSNIINRVRVN